MLKRLLQTIRQDRNLSGMLRGASLLYVAGALSIALMFVQQIWTASLLGAENYGRLATLVGSTALILLFADFRTREATMKYWTEYGEEPPEMARSATWLLGVDAVAGVIGAVLVLIFAQFIAVNMLQAPELLALVRAFGITIPFRLLANGVASAGLRTLDYFGWLAGKSIFFAVARLPLIVGGAMAGGLIGAIWGWIASEILNGLLMFSLLYAAWRRETGTSLLQGARPDALPTFRRTLSQLWVGETLQGLQVGLLIPLLALLTNPAVVGLFRSSQDIAELIQRLIEPIRITIDPRLMQVYAQESVAEFRRFASRITLLLALLTVPFVLFIVVLGPFLLPALLGEDYRGIALTTSILTLGLALNATFVWLRSAMVIADRLRQQNVVALGAFGLAMLVLFTAAPVYGAVGAAFARIVPPTVNTLLRLVILRDALRERTA